VEEEERSSSTSPTLFMTEGGIEVLSRDDNSSAKLAELSVRAVLVPHLSRNGLTHAHGGLVQSDVLVRAPFSCLCPAAHMAYVTGHHPLNTHHGRFTRESG
jgi:hypothetical protein